jgi:hypothetical protein
VGYFYHGAIPPAWLRVELRGRAGYAELRDPELGRVCELVRAEAENWVTDPAQADFVELRKELTEADHLWYVREAFPADRFDVGKSAPSV